VRERGKFYVGRKKNKKNTKRWKKEKGAKAGATTTIL
jgi:hypothetical protein